MLTRMIIIANTLISICKTDVYLASNFHAYNSLFIYKVLQNSNAEGINRQSLEHARQFLKILELLQLRLGPLKF